MDLHLTGKTVLITGASQGIGLAAAHAFAAEGCHLHLAARRRDVLDVVRRDIAAQHDVTVQVHSVDLGTTAGLQTLAAATADVDILVNNAGDVPAGALETLDSGALRRGIELKLLGYIELTKIYYGRMKTAGTGVIINNIGNSGENWDADYIAGSTVNAALMAFTRALGGVSLDDGIRVVGINPGPVATDRMVKLMKRRARDMFNDEGRWQELFDRYPAGRPATPEEVADLILFAASPRAGYVTGTIVTIDGGIAARGSIIKTSKRAAASP